MRNHNQTGLTYSSWTPIHNVARRFAKEYDGRVTSAWVPESAIHSSIPQLNVDSFHGDREHEIIVKPNSNIQVHEGYAPESSMKSSLDEKISNRKTGGFKNPVPEKLAASETDKVKSFMRHPREIYNDKKKENKRKIIAEKERQKTGAKKPFDIAMDKLKVDKAEMPKLPIAPKPLKTGDRVNHTQHGAGTVRQNHGDGHLTVGFDNSKDTSLNYKGLKVHSNDFKKSESDLKKMSQPIPSFPKIKSITTRPDSEIKPLEEKTYTLPPKNDKQSKYDGTYGMPRKFTQGDYAAKKFQAKMGKENPDVAEIIRNGVNSVAQGSQTHGSVISTGDKRVIMGQYNAKTGDPTKMHEAYHFTTKQIGQKLGLNEEEIGKISSHLLNHIHPDDYKAFRTIITARGYDPRRPDFDEEVVAHMGNYLNDKNFRESAHSAHLRPALINAPEEALAMHNLVRNPHETLNPNRFKAGYKSLIRAAKDLDERKIYEIIGNK
jgi:hypothetical protein